jgi:hypothetical protein
MAMTAMDTLFFNCADDFRMDTSPVMLVKIQLES